MLTSPTNFGPLYPNKSKLMINVLIEIYWDWYHHYSLRQIELKWNEKKYVNLSYVISLQLIGTAIKRLMTWYKIQTTHGAVMCFHDNNNTEKTIGATFINITDPSPPMPDPPYLSMERSATRGQSDLPNWSETDTGRSKLINSYLQPIVWVECKYLSIPHLEVEVRPLMSWPNYIP